MQHPPLCWAGGKVSGFEEGLGRGNAQAAVCPEPGHRSELSPLVEYRLESRENKAGHVAAGTETGEEGREQEDLKRSTFH